MSLESRSRMISFRLTDEEYERFRRLCGERGLRNVSELVRSAVNQMLGSLDDNPAKPGSEIQLRVETLESQITDLTIAVEAIERHMVGEPDSHRDGGKFKRASNT